MTPPDPTPEQPLEATIARLEEIVEQLESGELGLEESITLFAEGRRLGGGALKRLDALERRVQLIVSDADGNLRAEEFGRS